MNETKYERLLDATYNTADMLATLADALAKGNLIDADAMTHISETAKRESEGRKQYEALRKGPYYL